MVEGRGSELFCTEYAAKVGAIGYGALASIGAVVDGGAVFRRVSAAAPCRRQILGSMISITTKSNLLLCLGSNVLAERNHNCFGRESFLWSYGVPDPFGVLTLSVAIEHSMKWATVCGVSIFHKDWVGTSFSNL